MNEAKQTALALTAVQLSGAVSLPIILAGYFVGSHYETYSGLLLIAIGNCVLLTLALIYTHMGYRYQYITVELIAKFYGERGILLCGISLLVLLLGWSVIQYHLISVALQTMFGMTQQKYILAGTFVTALATYFAICHGLHRFALINKVLIPAILLVLLLALQQISHRAVTLPPMRELPAIIGLIMIMTTAGGLVFDCPTYYRHAQSLAALRVSLLLLFALIIPVIEVMGFYLAKYSVLALDGNSLTGLLQQFNVAGLLFLCVSSLLSNCLNIYSATLVAKHFVAISYNKVLFTFCMISACISLSHSSDSMLTYLEAINCLAGIILLMVVTERLMQGSHLNALSKRQQRRHEYLLYLTIVCVAMLQCVAGLKQYGLFITASMVSMIIMLIDCQVRRLLCVNSQ